MGAATALGMLMRAAVSQARDSPFRSAQRQAVGSTPNSRADGHVTVF